MRQAERREAELRRDSAYVRVHGSVLNLNKPFADVIEAAHDVAQDFLDFVAVGERNALLIFARWSRMGVFNRIFAELAGNAGTPDRLMIDATHLKAHRPAANLLKKGRFPAISVARKAV